MKNAISVGVTSAMFLSLAGAAIAANEVDKNGQSATDKSPQVARSCIDDLHAMGSEYNDEAPAFDAATRNDIRTLRNATMTLAKRGDAEACSRLVAEIAELREGALKQADAATRAANGDAEPAVPPEKPERATVLAAALPLETQGAMVRTSTLVGTDVVNPTDEHLGTVEDVMVNPAGDRAVFLMVAHGGLFGFGDDLTPVRVRDLKATEGLGELVLNMSKQQFDKAPSIDTSGANGPESEDSWLGDVSAWWDRTIGS